MSFPLLNPYGHVAFQAQRGDVHTVLVDGRVVKSDGKLVGVDLAPVPPGDRGDGRLPALRAGRGGLAAGHVPRRCRRTRPTVLDNPYQYTDYVDDAKRARRR